MSESLDTLARQVAEMENMLRLRKGVAARAIAQGQPVSVGDLSGINALEVRLANLRSLLRARELST